MLVVNCCMGVTFRDTIALVSKLFYFVNFQSCIFVCVQLVVELLIVTV